MGKIIILFYLWLVGKTIKIANLAGPNKYIVDKVTVSRDLGTELVIITLKRNV